MPTLPALGFQSENPKNAAEYGLGQAKGLLQSFGDRTIDFPANPTAGMTGPAQTDYYKQGDLQGMNRTEMPSYTGAQYSGAVNPLNRVEGAQYSGAVNPLNRTEMPSYKGLMGGDYDKLQSALTDPALQQISERYQKGNTAQDARMGAGGLYGSSIGQDMMDERTRGQGMAESDAINRGIAQRYGFQAEDLANRNQFGLQTTGMELGQERGMFDTSMQSALRGDTNAYNSANMELGQERGMFDTSMQSALRGDTNAYNSANMKNQFGLQSAGMQMGQEGDIFRSNLASSLRDDEYGANRSAWDDAQQERSRGYGNQIAGQDYQYGLMQRDYDRALEDSLFDKSMAMATGSMPGRTAQMASDSAENSAIYGALGNIGRGLTGGLMEWWK